MRYFTMGLTCLAVLASTAFVWASESDELRAKAKAMQREAAELAEHGHQEEAAELKRRVMELLEEAERLERQHPERREAEINQLHRLLEKLRLEEDQLAHHDGNPERLEAVRRKAEQVKIKLHKMSLDPHREHPVPQEDVNRRIEHMRMAVEHLNHAGLHDIAEHVAERAAVVEQEMHQQHQRHAGDVMHEMMRQIEQLRHEFGRLRDEVNALRERR